MSKEQRTKVILGIFLMSFLLRGYRLWEPPKHYFDEVYFSFTAQEMAKGNSQAWVWYGQAPKGFAFAWNHPPLGDQIIALFIRLLGDTPAVWRLPAALAGAGGSVVMFWIGELLFGSMWAGGFAAFLFTFDGLPFVQSRIGTTDSMLLLWQLLVFLSILWYRQERQRHHLLWGAVCGGLAISTKWSGVVSLIILGIWTIPSLLGSFHERWEGKIRSLLFYFVVIPVFVYLLVHLPFFISGHTWKEFIELQKQTWYYHANLKATHPYQSAWWQWPLLLKSIWFYVDYSQNAAGKVAHIYALGNPVIWWTGCVSIIALTVATLTQRKFLPAFLIINFGVLWLFWAPISRILFLYHYLPALMFMILGLVYWILFIWEREKLRYFVYLYLAAVVLVFLIFYPIYTALMIPKSYFESLLWIPSWR